VSIGIDENEDKTQRSIWYWFNTRPTEMKKNVTLNIRRWAKRS